MSCDNYDKEIIDKCVDIPLNEVINFIENLNRYSPDVMPYYGLHKGIMEGNSEGGYVKIDDVRNIVKVLCKLKCKDNKQNTSLKFCSQDKWEIAWNDLRKHLELYEVEGDEEAAWVLGIMDGIEKVIHE